MFQSRFLLLLLLSIFSSVDAAYAFNISGIVRSADDGDPLAGVTIALVADSVTQIETQTSAEGTFAIGNVSNRKGLCLSITYPGYTPLSMSIINGNEADLTFDDLRLSPSSIKLEGVVVKADRVVSRNDHTIIVPTEAEQKRATSPLNLLTNLSFNTTYLKINEPLRKITIDGQEPAILINGQPKELHDFMALSPERIEKVDFVLHPEPRFGRPYINIITRPIEKGGSAMVDANVALTTPKEWHQASGSVVRGNKEFSVNYDGLFRRGTKEYYDREEHYIGGGKDIELNSIGFPSKTIDREHRVQFDYTQVEKNDKVLSTTLELYAHSNTRHRLYDVKDISSSYIEKGYNHYNFVDPSLSLYYRNGNLKGGSFEMTFGGYYTNGVFNDAVNYSTGYENFSDTKNSALGVFGSLFYKKTYSSKFGTRFGLNYNYSNALNRYDNSASGKESIRKEAHKVLAYATVEGTLLTVYYSLNAQLAYHRINSNSFRPGGFVYFYRQLCKGLTGSYTYRITPLSPNIASVTDVLTPVNELLYHVGNPSLKSSLKQSHSLNFSYRKDKFNASLLSSYQRNSSPQLSIYRYVSDKASPIDGKFLNTIENGLYSENYDVGLNLSLSNLLNHFSIGGNVKWNKGLTRGTDYMFEKCSWGSSVYANFYVDRFSINASFCLIPAYNLNETNLYEDMRFNYINLGYNYKDWSFTLSWSNPFRKDGNKQRSWVLSDVHPQYNVMRMKDQANQICVGVRYQADFGHSLKKGQRSVYGGGFDKGVNL